MNCEKCMASLADTAKFCPKCGTPVKLLVVAQNDQAKLCPKCGATNPLSAKFCRVDGSVLEEPPGKTEISPTQELVVPEDHIRCPSCGVMYPPGVKFCKKDGTPLQDIPTIADGTTQAAAPIAETKQYSDDIAPAEPDVEVLKRRKKKPDNSVEQNKTENNAGVTETQGTPQIKKDPSEQPDLTIKCPECGAENTAGARFCKKDGALLAAALTAGDIGQTVSGIPVNETTVAPSSYKATLVAASSGTEAVVTTEAVAGKSVAIPEKDTGIQTKEVKSPVPSAFTPPAHEPVREELARAVPKAKSNNAVVWIVLIIVLFAAGGGGGYYYFKQSKQKNESKYVSESASGVIPSPAPNQTAPPLPAPEPMPTTAPNQRPVLNQTSLPAPTPKRTPPPATNQNPASNRAALPVPVTAPLPAAAPNPKPVSNVVVGASAIVRDINNGRPVGSSSNFRVGASNVAHYVNYAMATPGQTTFSSQFYKDGAYFFKCASRPLKFQKGNYFCRTTQHLDAGDYEVQFSVDGLERQVLSFRVN